MDSLHEIRKIAQQKYYEKFQAQQEEEKRVKEDETRRKQEEDRINNELERTFECTNVWDEYLANFPFTIVDMNKIERMLRDTIALFKKYDRMDELQKRTMQLIDILNLQQEELRSNANDVRKMADCMKNIISLTELEVEIDIMDVSRDVEMALHLQEDFYREIADHVVQVPLVMPPPLALLEQANANAILPVLPICSIERRVGLTVPQLKDLARQHGLRITGTKQELCMRLSEAGWVRLV